MAVIVPLVLLHAISASFLNREALVKLILPRSYESAIPLIAGKFASNGKDAQLFQERIRGVVSKEDFVSIFEAPIDLFSGQIGNLMEGRAIVADFSPIKQKLRQLIPQMVKRMKPCNAAEQRIEQFRFCKPAGFPSGKEFEKMVSTVLEKQFPPKSELKPGKDYNFDKKVQLALKIIYYAYKKFLFVIIAVAAFLLALTALIIYSPKYLVLRYLGRPLFSAGLVIFAITLLFSRLPEEAQKIKALTPVQAEFAKFMLSQPNRFLIIWGSIFIVLSVLLYIFSKRLKPKKK